MTGKSIKLKIQSLESVIIGATISLMHVKRENPMHRKFQLRFMQFYYYITYLSKNNVPMARALGRLSHFDHENREKRHLSGYKHLQK